MIHNDDQLRNTREALEEVESALALLQRDRARIHPDRFVMMAEPLLDDIRRLRGEIEEYVGVTAVRAEEAPLWLRLQGPGIELDDAPTSVVTAIIDLLRVGVQAVAEFLQRGMLGGRPTAALKDASDLRIVGWAPGSVQVGLRLPASAPTLVPEADPATQARLALQLYLQAAAWAGSEDDLSQLELDLPDPEQRRLLLNQVARLIPRPRGSLQLVELSGPAVPCGPVRLRRETRERVRQAITRTVQEETSSTEGVVREIDLDQRTFIVRDLETGAETRCAIAADADGLLGIAKDALDHRVLVVGVRRRHPARRQAVPLLVREIDVLGADGGERFPAAGCGRKMRGTP